MHTGEHSILTGDTLRSRTGLLCAALDLVGREGDEDRPPGDADRMGDAELDP